MKSLLMALFGFVLFSFAVITGIQGLVMASDNVPVVVKVDGREVYSGPSYAIKTETNGYATKVTIRGGYMAMFPRKYFVSKDVVVVGEK